MPASDPVIYEDALLDLWLELWPEPQVTNGVFVVSRDQIQILYTVALLRAAFWQLKTAGQRISTAEPETRQYKTVLLEDTIRWQCHCLRPAVTGFIEAWVVERDHVIPTANRVLLEGYFDATLERVEDLVPFQPWQHERPKVEPEVEQEPDEDAEWEAWLSAVGGPETLGQVQGDMELFVAMTEEEIGARGVVSPEALEEILTVVNQGRAQEQEVVGTAW